MKVKNGQNKDIRSHLFLILFFPYTYIFLMFKHYLQIIHLKGDFQINLISIKNTWSKQTKQALRGQALIFLSQ